MAIKFNKKNLLIFLYPFLFFLSAAAAYTIKHLHNSPTLPANNTSISPPPATAPTPATPTPDKPLNILVLGYGGPGHSGGSLTDIIIVLHLDPQNQHLTFISIPRDIWVSQSNGPNKVNAAFATSADSAKQAITTITGLPINYYLGIDFVGVQRAIHEIGGIDVQVTQTFDDPWYPITGEELASCGKTPEEITSLTATMSGFTLEKQFPCRYEHLHFDSGPNFMEGADVLKFVRSRHSTSDFARSQRAQAVLIAIKDKLLTLKAFDDAPAFFSQIVTHLNTDINTNVVNYLSPTLNQLTNYQIKNIHLTLDNVLSSSKSSRGASILIPKAGQDQWSSTHQYILNELNL